MNHKVPSITAMMQIYGSTEGSHINMLLIWSLNDCEDKNNPYSNKYNSNNNKLGSTNVSLPMPM